jgi:hypothetical protein
MAPLLGQPLNPTSLAGTVQPCRRAYGVLTTLLAVASPFGVLSLCRAAKQVLQAGADMQAFLDRLALYKARGSLQLEGSLHSLGDFSISLARAVQVR